MTRPVHGGDVDATAREYGLRPDELIDFSASINPLGPPPSVIERLRREVVGARGLARYPDPRYSELRSTLADTLPVPCDCLSIANGSAGLLRAIIASIRPRRCLLPVPAFGEQTQPLVISQCEVDTFPLSAAAGFRFDVAAFCSAIASKSPDLCIVTNPHNPSGALASAAEMSRVLDAMAPPTVLLIDEAFIDFAPEETLTIAATRSDQLIVLRSLTKFYSMPAMRVGYAVTTPSRAAQIDAHLPTWPVTTMAAAAAAEALRDEAYAGRTIRALTEDRAYLRELLTATGLAVYASAGNFLLIRLPATAPDAAALRTALIQRFRMIVRDCSSFEGMEEGRFIRVAVRARPDNERLAIALATLLREERR